MKCFLIRGLSLLLACIMLSLAGIEDFVVQAAENYSNQYEEDVLIAEDDNLIGDSNSNAEQNPIVKKEQILETEQELTVTVGESFQIEIVQSGDGEIIYESMNPEIAEVDESGIITAHSAGKTEVIVCATETSLYLETEISITIIVTKKKQDISVENMVFYYGDETKQICFENLTGNNPIFTVDAPEIAEVDEEGYITPAKVGQTVVHVFIPGNNEYEDAVFDINVIVKTTLSEPELIKAVGASNGVITITWNKVPGADGYYLYEKFSKGAFKLKAIIEDSDTLKYVSENVRSGFLYTYEIEAFANEGNNVSERSNTKTAKYLLTSSVVVQKTGTMANLKWTQVTGAGGYYIYRKRTGEKNWKYIGKTSAGTALTWSDKYVGNGKNNSYSVKAYYEDSIGASSKAGTLFYLKSPSVKSLTRKKKSSKMTVKWNRNSLATGYQLQYADNRLFHNAKTITIKNNRTVNKTIKRLSKSRTYYVRIRAYKKSGGKYYYSDWSLSSNARSTKTATYSSLKYNKKIFELRAMAGQYVGGYDTVQGGCSDGIYAYYALYNRKVEKCKIVKVKLSNMKVIKVSEILDIAHGNDMTYNSTTKRLIVIHTNINGRRISVINPYTLKEEEIYDGQIPSKLAGVRDKELEKLQGFTGIAYNAKRKQYATLLKSTGDLMILNSNFKAIAYIKQTNKSTLTKQGIDVTDDYILISYSGSTNVIMVYTWEGQYISKINVKKGYEIENIYHVGKQYYATFYRSYYKNKKLVRDNYVYKISGF